MTTSPTRYQPAYLRASLIQAVLIWLGISSIATAAAAVIVFGI